MKDLKKSIHELKFISDRTNAKPIRDVIRNGSDTLIKGMCNAILNAQRNKDITLTEAERNHYKKFSKRFSQLVSRKLPIKSKRKILVQKGNGPFLLALAPLLGTILQSVGSRIFGGRDDNA